MRSRRLLLHGAAAVGLLLACSGAEEGPGAGDEAMEPRSLAGPYEVTGVTIDAASGAQRPISGRIVIEQEGERYTTHFELETLYPGSEAVAAAVVGTGEGSIHGNRFDGTAETQLVVASVPGVDVGFAYVPRSVSTRIFSRAHGEVLEDGTLRVEIENAPAEGEEEYSPTHTTLVGYRIEGR